MPGQTAKLMRVGVGAGAWDLGGVGTTEIHPHQTDQTPAQAMAMKMAATTYRSFLCLHRLAE